MYSHKHKSIVCYGNNLPKNYLDISEHSFFYNGSTFRKTNTDPSFPELKKKRQYIF